MKVLKVLVLAGILSAVLVSCKTTKTVSTIPKQEIELTKLSKEDQRKFDYFFIEANRLKMLGNLERASQMLQECLNIDPKSAATFFELGKLYLGAQDIENAEKFIKMAADLNPKNEWYRYYLAGIYEQNKEVDKSIETYKVLAEQFPSKLEYQYRLGLLYTQKKEFSEAINVYNKVESIAGISEPLSLEKHNLYLQNNDIKNGIKEIEKLKKAFPKQPRYHVLLGDAYVDDKEFKKAYKEYNKALLLDSDYGPVHMSLAGYYDLLDEPEASQKELLIAFESNSIPFESKLRILVQYMMQTTKDSTKVENLQELVNIMLINHPDEPDLHYYYGNYLMSQQQTDEALEQFIQVVEIDPSRYETWLQIIGFYFTDENWDKAIETADKAISAQNDIPQAYLYKGIAAFQKEDFSLALNAFLKGAIFATSDDDLRGQFYSNIGDTYYRLGNKENAFEHYEKALQLNDHNIMVLNNYSYYLSLENTDLTKAATMSAKCVELEPGNSTYLDTYAWVLFKMKNYSLANFYIKQAIANLKSDNPEVFDHYGDILYMNGEKEEALVWWKKAADLGLESDVLEKKISTGELTQF